MKRKVKEFIENTGFIKYIIYPFLGILVALLGWLIPSSFVENNFNLWGSVIVIAANIILSAVVVYIMDWFLHRTNNEMCKNSVSILNNFIQEKVKHNSLISYEELAKIEEEVEADEKILIFTKEFKLDEDEDFQNNVILKNFKEGVKYIYIIPDDAATINDFRTMVSKWIKKDKNIKDKTLIEAFQVDKTLVYMTIAIYNANSTKDVIVKFPSGTFDKSKYPFIFRLAPDDSRNKKEFYNAIMEYIVEEDKGDKKCNKIKLWD